jgi:putative drug exporter of the RND superfamily
MDLSRLARRGGTPLALALGVALVGALVAPTVLDRVVPDGAANARGDSAQAKRLLHAYIGRDPQPAMVVTATGRLGPRSPVRAVAMAALVSQLRSDPAVVAVHRGPRARRGRTASLVAFFGRGSERDKAEAARRIGRSLDGGPLKLAVGGRYPVLNAIADREKRDFARALLMALPFAVVLLALFAGSLVRAVVCLLAAALAVLATMPPLALVQSATDLPVSAVLVAALASLYVALQTALLVLMRYRRELEAGEDEGRAAGRATRWAARVVLLGSAVAGAGALALAILPSPVTAAAAIPGLVAALVAGPAALVATRAAITVLGERLDKGRLGRSRPPNPAGSAAYRFTAGLMPVRLPLVVAVAATNVGLALPIHRVELPAADSTLLAADAPARAPDRQLGSAIASPVLIAAVGHDDRRLSAYARRLARVPGVRAVTEPAAVGPDVRLMVGSTRDDPGEEGARRAVRAMRAVETPFPVSIGGIAAESLDQRASLEGRVPIAAGVAILLAVVALGWLTATLGAAIKASLVLLLGTAAALGSSVLIFGDGRLPGLLDYAPRGGVGLGTLLAVTVLGAAVFAAFAGAMLVGMIEESDTGADPREQVVRGMEAIAPAALGAAAAGLALAAGMILSGLEPLKELGAGFAAVLIAQVLVGGMVLSPALLGLFARLNWWPRSANGGGR